MRPPPLVTRRFDSERREAPRKKCKISGGFETSGGLARWVPTGLAAAAAARRRESRRRSPPPAGTHRWRQVCALRLLDPPHTHIHTGVAAPLFLSTRVPQHSIRLRRGVAPCGSQRAPTARGFVGGARVERRPTPCSLCCSLHMRPARCAGRRRVCHRRPPSPPTTPPPMFFSWRHAQGPQTGRTPATTLSICVWVPHHCFDTEFCHRTRVLSPLPKPH
jgi:hypothetical protein